MTRVAARMNMRVMRGPWSSGEVESGIEGGRQDTIFSYFFLGAAKKGRKTISLDLIYVQIIII